MDEDLDDSAETRDTPPPNSSAAVQDHDEEPAETRETPARTGAQPQPAGQEGQDPAQTAADAAMAALESDALYQQLPPGYKRKVLAGMPVAEAIAQRNRQLLISGQANARALASEQRKTAEAIQRLEQTHQMQYADLERRAEARIEKLIRTLTGEPEPEVKPQGPVDPRDQLLVGMAQKLDGLTAHQVQQTEEQIVQSEIRAVEEYSAADVARAVATVPWYEEAEQYVQGLAYTAELAAINDAYPEMSDDQASRYAAQRVMEVASNLMVEARNKGVSLAAEVIGFAQSHGFRPRGQGAPQQQVQPAAPRPGSSAARMADQQRREQSVVGATGGGRGRGPSLGQSAKDIAAAALEMSDEDFADFIGEGVEGDKRLRSIVSQRAE